MVTYSMKDMEMHHERKEEKMRSEHHMKRESAYEPKQPESHDMYPEAVMEGRTKPYC